MRKALLAAIICTTVFLVWPAHALPPIRVMILDGESAGAHHDWQRVTPVLKKMLDETDLFHVTVVTAPPASADFGAFEPGFANYRVVVMNYDAPDERWPAALKTSFEQYMRNGGDARGRQCVSMVARVQRDDWTGWLARPHRDGRPVLVLQRRSTRFECHGRPWWEPRPPGAISADRPRRDPSHHQGAS
jgi:hypothetical protein